MSKTTDIKDKDKRPDDRHILSKLEENYKLGLQHYGREHRRMKMLNETDQGDLWKAIGAKFPPYQILPDTNLVSYVKDNLLASLYTTAKSAEVRPTSDDDKELCTKLNLVLDNFWSTANIGYKQFEAGERAALLNLGITQVGWNESIFEGKGDYQSKGRVVVENVDPMHFMRDPFAKDLDSASWCCTYDRYHKSVFLSNKDYKDAFEEWLRKSNGAGAQEYIPNYDSTRENSNNHNYFNLFHWWVRNPDGGVDEYHTVDTDVILFRRLNIKPAVFPFALLYCNMPASSLIGASSPAKIFSNMVAYNIMNSLALTAEYKNQRPPKFISAQSGLNVDAFTRHGNEADRTFIVQQDASKAVHYQQYPQISPQIYNFMQGLHNDVQDVSGVDARYTGRDTGSIITTGGTEEMLNRVTIIDTPKIVNYENYTKDLTKLILSYMIEYSPKRMYFIRKPNTSSEYESVEIDFPKIDSKTLFDYDIQISSELPKNKQRIAAWADMIMEKQMQYREGGGQVELLTEEEWLMLQDVPFKEMLLERMGFQRDTNAIKETTQMLFQYSSLIEQGMSPEEAMLATAQTLEKTRMGQPLEQADMMPQMAAAAPVANGVAPGMSGIPGEGLEQNVQVPLA